MKRWNVLKRAKVENIKIDAFLVEGLEVCQKHGMSISHEDGHGAFEVVAYDKKDADWLLNAKDCINT